RAAPQLEHGHGQESRGPGRAAGDRVLGAELTDDRGATVSDPHGEGEPRAHPEHPEDARRPAGTSEDAASGPGRIMTVWPLATPMDRPSRASTPTRTRSLPA